MLEGDKTVRGGEKTSIYFKFLFITGGGEIPISNNVYNNIRCSVLIDLCAYRDTDRVHKNDVRRGEIAKVTKYRRITGMTFS